MMCSSSPKATARMLVRISFGLSLLFVGMTHYMDFDSYSLMVSDGLGPLAMLGTVWSYVMPALMIVGGALFVIGVFRSVAVWTSGIALASIPAGMLLKPVLSGVGLDETMPPALTAFVWLLVFLMVAKDSCGGMMGCGSACASGCGAGCGCGKPGCNCPAPGSKMSAPAPAAKAPVKKPTVKKSV